jgi:hypothetical protein
VLKRLLVIASIAVLGMSDAWAADACTASIPEALRVLISGQFPEYRPPQQSDYDAVSMKFTLDHRSYKCLGVAQGTYYPGEDTDYAIILSSTDGTHALLVVASPANSTWRLERVWDWEEVTVGSLYVDTTAPGKYERTDALQGPVRERTERKRYTSQRHGILAGTIESSIAAFFFDGKGWIHVWISD